MRIYMTRTLFYPSVGILATASLILASSNGLVETGDTRMQESRDDTDPKDCQEFANTDSQAVEVDSEISEAKPALAWVGQPKAKFKKRELWVKKAIDANSEKADMYSLIDDFCEKHSRYKDACENLGRSLDLRNELSTHSRAGHLVWLMADPLRVRQVMKTQTSNERPHAENPQ